MDKKKRALGSMCASQIGSKCDKEGSEKTENDVDVKSDSPEGNTHSNGNTAVPDFRKHTFDVGIKKWV